MNKMVKAASILFIDAGVLRVLKAAGEMFGGYAEDFNTLFLQGKEII